MGLARYGESDNYGETFSEVLSDFRVGPSPTVVELMGALLVNNETMIRAATEKGNATTTEFTPSPKISQPIVMVTPMIIEVIAPARDTRLQKSAAQMTGVRAAP